MMRHSAKAWFAGLVTMLATLGATAIELRYSQVDMPDSVLGQDAWQYQYTFTGQFQAFEGLTLLYDPTTYTSLAAGPVDNLFSTLVIQPDPALGADGLIQLTATSALPSSFGMSFAVDFVRIGNLPAGHGYEVFDDGFNVVATGQATLAPIPEPSVAAMLLTGVAVLAARRRRSAATPDGSA